MEKNLPLNEQEGKNLIGLLDIAVKSQGLSAAPIALNIVTKLQKIFNEPEEVKDGSNKELPKEKK